MISFFRKRYAFVLLVIAGVPGEYRSLAATLFPAAAAGEAAESWLLVNLGEERFDSTGEVGVRAGPGATAGRLWLVSGRAVGEES